MQGTEATFDEVSFEGGDGPRRVLQKVLPGAAAVALAGAVGVWALHLPSRPLPWPTLPDWPIRRRRSRPKPFGDIVIDANLLAEMKRRSATLRRKWRASKLLRPLPTRRSRCRASRLFRPFRRPRKPRACPCRRRTRAPKSAKRRCRRLVRLSSARCPRQPAIRSNRTWRRLALRLRSTTAASSRNCSGSGNRPRRRSPPRRRQHGVAGQDGVERFGGLERIRGDGKPRRRQGPVVFVPVAVRRFGPGLRLRPNIPPSMTSPPASSICRTERKLEAHSGLGDALDNPRYVSRARGAARRRRISTN